MNKRDLFNKAMQSKCYERLAWIFSAFCITRENEDEYKKDPYSYRIVSTPTGYFYCDPEQNGSLVKIEDATVGTALYSIKDKIEINPGDIPNLKETLIVTYGGLLTNWIILINPFGTKLDYINGRINISYIEKLILSRLKDTPDDLADKNSSDIYIDEYVKFADSVYFLTGLTQVCVWATTEKIMLPPPGIVEYRNKLLEENKDHLNEAATIAKIDAQLVQYDKDWMKDDPGANFLLSNKSTAIVRKKLFLMHGGETGLDANTVNVTLIKNSLNEGWDINAFPAMNNSLRAGSFNRGANTALGGVSVKWLLRASSNMNVTEDDCGSRIGKVLTVSDSNMNDLIGFNVILKEGSKQIVNEEDAASYLGKKVMVRSPMYCKLTHTDFCKVCVGKNLAANINGLSIAVSDYGSRFMDMMMSAVHGKELKLAKMDYKSAIM